MNKKQPERIRLIYKAIAALVILLVVLGLLIPAFIRTRSVIPYRMVCQTNLSRFAKAIEAYSIDNDGKYPTVAKWCDLLVQNGYATEKLFRCPGNKKDPCGYAMNANVEPNSPADVVLLFDAKGGWNQYGCSELLTPENHKGKGCNILFNDGHVEFVKPKNLSKLNWGDEQEE
ncbi:MAG: hypothetical protein ACYS9Y_01455 [Planctomycetota bacterium]|jgi:prepilin-type processing-associated H-X9-DG protein